MAVLATWNGFIILNFENDRSAVATVTGIVKNIINNEHTSGKLLLIS